MTTAKPQPLTLGWIGTGRMGSVLATRLLEQIETGAQSRRRLVFNPELVVRGSTVPGADAPAGHPSIPAFATE